MVGGRPKDYYARVDTGHTAKVIFHLLIDGRLDMKLSAADVSRAGRTARSWNEGTDKVDLDHEEGFLRLKFSLSSKGGGITDILMTIGAADFSALLGAMVSADRGRAMREMSAALAAQIAKQPEHDRVVIRKARKSVLHAARRSFDEAPEGRNHAERLTRDMVHQLVEQLEKADESKLAGESEAA
jgi:hypothetical protein